MLGTTLIQFLQLHVPHSVFNPICVNTGDYIQDHACEDVYLSL